MATKNGEETRCLNAYTVLRHRMRPGRGTAPPPPSTLYFSDFHVDYGSDSIFSRPQQQSLRPGGAPAYSLSDSMFPNVIFCEIFIMGRSLDDRFHVDSGSDRVCSPRKTRIRWTRSSLYPRSHLIPADRQLFQTLIGAVTSPVPRHPSNVTHQTTTTGPCTGNHVEFPLPTQCGREWL